MRGRQRKMGGDYGDSSSNTWVNFDLHWDLCGGARIQEEEAQPRTIQQTAGDL